MQTRTYILSSIPEYILVVAMSAAMTFILATGFNVAESLQFNYGLIIGACAVMTAGLFASRFNRTATLVGIGVFVVAAIALVVLANMGSSSAGVLSDTASNPNIFVAILVLTTLIVFLGTRLRVTAFITFIVGVILGSLIQYLYLWNEYKAYIVFAVAGLALVFYRSYLISFFKSSARKSAFGPAALVSLLLCVVVVGASAGLYEAFIAPMNLQLNQVKLITRHMRMDQEKVKGTLQYRYVVDNSNTSTDAQDSDELTNQTGNVDADLDSTDSPLAYNVLGSMAGGAAGAAKKAAAKVLHYIRYGTPDWVYILLSIILLLIIFGPYIAKKIQRFYLWRRMQKWSPSKQILWMYAYYQRKLKVLRLDLPAGLTPAEYGEAFAPYMASFGNNKLKVDMAQLTADYLPVAYGGAEPASGALERYHCFHRHFYRSCLSYLGPIRYFFRFLRL